MEMDSGLKCFLICAKNSIKIKDTSFAVMGIFFPGTRFPWSHSLLYLIRFTISNDKFHVSHSFLAWLFYIGNLALDVGFFAQVK